LAEGNRQWDIGGTCRSGIPNGRKPLVGNGGVAAGRIDNLSESKYLLDTSAILTLLEDEEGAERVEILLRQEQILLPYLVLLETYYITL
jgi:hypothetical protein